MMLKQGSFYWVRVTINGTDDNAGEWQPARYTGRDFGHRDTWDYIGEESASGHHHVEVVEIGLEITRPHSSEAWEAGANIHSMVVDGVEIGKRR